MYQTQINFDDQNNFPNNPFFRSDDVPTWKHFFFSNYVAPSSFTALSVISLQKYGHTYR